MWLTTKWFKDKVIINMINWKTREKVQVFLVLKKEGIMIESNNPKEPNAKSIPLRD